MSFTPGTDEPGMTRGDDLLRRLDGFEVRLANLEAMLLDDGEPAALADQSSDEPDRASVDAVRVSANLVRESMGLPPAPDTPDPEAPEIAAADAASAPEHPDLRRLQAEATADLPLYVTPPHEPPKPRIDLGDLEERLAGRALALVGGAALLLGAIFFLSLAFSRGWIGPQLQVALGLVGGSFGLTLGAVLLFHAERTVGHVLTAVGLAVISLSLFAATSLYGLIEPPLALLGVLLAATATTIIAIRSASQAVAGFGLVAALAAPPILGASADLGTVGYMAVALLGIAVVALWQTWPWLPPLAFVLSVPQLAQWIATEPDTALSVATLLAYWTVLTVAAGGEAFRATRRELSLTSAPLFLANGAAVVGLAFIALPGDTQRAAFLLALAVMHGLVAAFFLRRRGPLAPFGLLAGAYGMAMASAAVPLLLNAPASAVVWTAEAAALAVLARRHAHGPALLAALALFATASADLAYQALALGPAADLARFGTVSGTGPGVTAAFAFLTLSVAVTLVVVPVRANQVVLLGLLGLVALPIVPLLLEGAASVTAWMLMAVATAGTPRWIVHLPELRIRWRLGQALRWIRPTQAMTPIALLIPWTAGTVATCLAVALTAALFIDQTGLPGVPFTDEAGLAALALAAGSVAIGLVVGAAASLRRGLFWAGLVIGIGSVVEMAAPWYVLVWAALAIGAAMMSRVDSGGILSYRHMAVAALIGLCLLAYPVAPPERLLVRVHGVPPHMLLISHATLAIGSLAIALGAVALAGRGHWPRMMVMGLAALAGASVLYLLSVGTVDVFAGEAFRLALHTRAGIRELAKESQVALSVLWATVGALVLGAGLIARASELRLAGLAVLGLATVKVFLVDLSSLDVAYRVVTLLVLGLLLIASAYVWNRMRPGDARDDSGRAGGVDTTPGDAGARL
jgi:uncharacterized membrane protein